MYKAKKPLQTPSPVSTGSTVGPLIPLFQTSGDVSLSFKSKWAALFTVGRGVYVTQSPRFTSGATPADLLAASMATEPFSSVYLRAGIGVNYEVASDHMS